MGDDWIVLLLALLPDPICALRPVPISPIQFEIVKPSGQVLAVFAGNGITDPAQVRVTVSSETTGFSLTTVAAGATDLGDGTFRYRLPTPPLQNGTVLWSVRAKGRNCLGPEASAAFFVIN